MNDSVAAVDSKSQNAGHELRPTEPGSSRATPFSPGRFTYPSGSRPLAGYTLKRGIGHGGFGEVYYAQSDGGKEVALKLIRRNLEVELRGIRQCLNLKHPHLLSIHDIREDDEGDAWVVMEYVTGQSLEEAIAEHPEGMPVPEVLAWIHGIGAGVGYLHDHGIVHRDLKPANIFSDDGVVKIGDYGLSKFISCSRRSGQTESVGTVHYMAPEVANGRYGKEIDIYALGVILYEMLTGRVPFEGESVGEVLMKHLTAAADVSMLAEPFRSIVARALEKDPARRFATAAEMLAALPRPPVEPLAAAVPTARPVTEPGGGRPIPAAIPLHEIPVADAVPEEPIFREVRRFCIRAHDTWNESNLNTPAKVVILVVGIFAVLALAQGLLPVVFCLLGMYGVYWLIWKFVLSKSPKPHEPPRRAAAAAGPPAPGPERTAARAIASSSGRPGRARAGQDPREKLAEALLRKPARQRLAELFGSLLGSALVAMTMCLVMIILLGFRGALPRVEQTMWVMLTSVAGAWAILIPSKFWEARPADAMLRRFIMMTAGLGLGLLACGLASFLQVELPYDQKFANPQGYQLPPNFYDNGRPLLLAYLACFGTFFLLIRWWRQTDPLRSTRMSIWSMVICVAVAGLVAGLWLFPQPWLMVVACGVSASVQLASPWVHPRQRKQLAEAS